MKRIGGALAVLWILKHLGMLAGALALFLMGCDVSPSGPSPVPEAPGVSQVPAVVGEWWERAQTKLAKYGVDGSRVRAEDFNWIARSGQFSCGDVPATSGCYEHRTRTITYEIGQEYVLCHEAGHGILSILGDSRKSCWEHSCLKEVGPCFSTGGEIE